ncbi:MAG: hypothetical protein HFJ12_07585 [Bacilli bacterium]|nr:hypothetical protein [Bacilli bacterium]
MVDGDNVAIRLGINDIMTKGLLNNFKSDLEKLFDKSIDYTKWEKSRDEFLNVAIDNLRSFNMAFSRSYCIGDLENDGCKIIKKESNREKLTTKIDFKETDSKLCSIVVFIDSIDFTQHFINKRNLCFEAYADDEISIIQVEIALDNVDMAVEIVLCNDENTYRIPLIQFCDSIRPWKKVTEIKFVIHRKRVTGSGNIVIKNLRLE